LRRLAVVSPSELAVTVINVEEQITGWQIYLRRAKTDKELAMAYEKLAASVRVLSGMHILGFSEAAIARYNLLLAMKLNVGKMDLRIAAIALEEGATVITRNLRDFQRVPELICENWAD
jgi:tRNA(fMet)-specific endonuclease VapC